MFDLLSISSKFAQTFIDQNSFMKWLKNSFLDLKQIFWKFSLKVKVNFCAQWFLGIFQKFFPDYF